MDCNWCHVPIRERTVIVGPSPGRPVRLFIDKAPHEDGRVIEREDGTFRLLSRGRERENAVVPKYRVHGRKSCDPKVRVEDQRINPGQRS